MTTLLEILQHALGRDEFGQRKRGATEDYRNHFVTDEGGPDWDLCEEAVRAGFMTKHPPRAISGGDWIFVVTPNGKAHVDYASPKPPKVSRSKARYLVTVSNEPFATTSDLYDTTSRADEASRQHGRK